jgi:hypothetical protein
MAIDSKSFKPALLASKKQVSRSDSTLSFSGAITRTYKTAFLATFFIASMTNAGFSKAADSPIVGDSLVYVIKKGDTLNSIKQEFLTADFDWQSIARANNLTDPKKLPVGREIKLPIKFLNSQTNLATVTSVAGKVTLDGKPLSANTKVQDTSKIETYVDSAVELLLSDGTTMRIGSASSIVIERLRQYHSASLVEARIRLIKGRVEASVSPERKKPFDILTPGATAAVRGTKFGVSVDAMPNATAVAGAASVDVPTGSVEWLSASQKQTPGIAVPAGFGAAALANGEVTAPELLLPPIAIGDLPNVTTKAISNLVFAALPLAKAYRVQIASDEDFKNVLSETLTSDASVVLNSNADGPHYIRVKALSANLVEGHTAKTLVNVAARPAPPADALPASNTARYSPDVVLTWPDHQGLKYRVQLAQDERFTKTTFDSVIASASTTVTLKPGVNYWRVASVETNLKQGPFSDIRKIELKMAPAPPKLNAVDDLLEIISELALGSTTAQLEVRLETMHSNGEVTQSSVQTFAHSPIKLQLAPGQYRVMTRYKLSGFAPDEIPSGPNQTVTMKEPLRGASGDSIKAGDGTSVILGR